MQNQNVLDSQAHRLATPKRGLREPFRSWAGQGSCYPRHLSVADAFEETAAKFADKIAISFHDERLRYCELNTQATCLAQRLKDSGVGANDLVALCAERSIEMIAGLLGILKAGGAYVPIDPSLPAERIHFLLRETNPRLILTQSRFAAKILAGQNRALILLDQKMPGRFHSDVKQKPSSSRDLAYVMYTSGSTGKPKGVMVEHRSILRLVRNTNYCDFSPDHVFLQAAPISFDASTFEIWGALLNGAHLVLLPAGVTSLEDLGSTILTKEVTTLWLTSGLFHLMVEQRLADLRNVKQLLTGGDVVSPARAREVLRALPYCTLINGYGPTENTTFTCCHRMKAGEVIENSVPIGRPVANTQVYLLDSDGVPVEQGAVGEIHAAGDGLARGYLNDPELTARAFVENPFAEEDGERMYRTGDLASWRADGTLEFVGRIDDQVKILGHRVEPAEVQAALRAHPGVLQAYVSGESGSCGSKRLVAYFADRPQEPVSAAGLRMFLGKTLPPYMIPSDFVRLHSLPLAANGKIDREALRAALDTGSAKARVERFSAEADDLERTIRSVWSDVLQSDDIACDANFFDVGGNSLLLVSMHGKLQAAMHRSIPIVDLFQFTTIEKLARHLAEERPARPRSESIACASGDSRSGAACEASRAAGGGR
jgi:aspartate racemase